jgi:hypothetical protein
MSGMFILLCNATVGNALDGSEDDILWEDDGEDKDNSDWVMNYDLVMNHDDESGE